MATLALSVAGQFVGGLIGGPIGATIGRALGALAGSSIDQQLFGGQSGQPVGKLDDLNIQTSREGAPMRRIYGWNRVAGELIWATQLVETLSQNEQDGGKAVGNSGAKSSAHYSYSANFAIGLCEGEISHFGRIWADGKLLDQSQITVRFYTGSNDQLPDSLIEAKEGAGDALAYRGLAYAVFELLPLADYGNRLPQLTFEICRTVGQLEKEITALTLIPGASEFGYDPRPLFNVVQPGIVKIENTHQTGVTSDWEVSLDQMQSLFPNLESVALVVSWFGTDLRVGECQILPGIENRDKNIAEAPWRVSNATRSDAHQVSTWLGSPAYGGTPNDASIVRAIKDLNARGIKVTFYPFLLMDIAGGNELPDPYGSAEQADFPWRGRITCHPAIGQPGTPDKSAAAASQIANFLGSASAGDFVGSGEAVVYSGPAEWSFRRMILHYAHLCKLAGGVDTFLIGSELRGLTQVRQNSDTFPFVTGLTTLAQDVRTILGGATLLTYGADWSEYFGYQPSDGSSDVFFNLDPLWASSAIDVIGIDNYMPLADWRDGNDHLDAQGSSSIYQRSYLQGNIAGGEGYDWYYASDAARADQTRSTISDGAYGEPWIYRYKDLVSWWQNPHHNRPGGVRDGSPTSFVPQSKPIWFTEVGCGAVDKGANQPNLFSDPKSDESGTPYFSNGLNDPFMQRQYLYAQLSYWRIGGQGYELGNNPVSSIYGKPMLDADRLYVWTWDARPFPAFPSRSDIWTDAPNWETGHWLNGRSGIMTLQELLEAILNDYGVTDFNVEAETMLVDGYRIEGVTTARRAIEPLISAANLQLFSCLGEIQITRAQPRTQEGNWLLSPSELAVQKDEPVIEKMRADKIDLAGQLTLDFIDRIRDYRASSIVVRTLARTGANADTVALPLTMSYDSAELLARNLLQNLWAGQESLKLALPPSQIGLSVGDVFQLEGALEHPYVVIAINDTDRREIEARGIEADDGLVIESVPPDFHLPVPLGLSQPLVHVFQLPGRDGLHDKINLHAAVFADPWPGSYALFQTYAGAENLIASVSAPATIGTLTQDLAVGTQLLWDRENSLELELTSGHLASVEANAALAGANRLAVERDDGTWELLGFATAELIGVRTYRLTNLLRGLRGSGGNSGASTGNGVVLFDEAIVTRQLEIEALEQEFQLKAIAAGSGYETPIAATVTPVRGPLQPLPPVHLFATRAVGQNDIAVGWLRQSRRGGLSWAASEVPLDVVPEKYLLQIYEGAVLRREIVLASPTYLYAEADQIADFGSLPSTLTCQVAQVSDVFGNGQITTGVFNV